MFRNDTVGVGRYGDADRRLQDAMYGILAFIFILFALGFALCSFYYSRRYLVNRDTSVAAHADAQPCPITVQWVTTTRHQAPLCEITRDLDSRTRTVNTAVSGAVRLRVVGTCMMSSDRITRRRVGTETGWGDVPPSARGHKAYVVADGRGRIIGAIPKEYLTAKDPDAKTIMKDMYNGHNMTNDTSYIWPFDKYDNAHGLSCFNIGKHATLGDLVTTVPMAALVGTDRQPCVIASCETCHAYAWPVTLPTDIHTLPQI